MDAVTADFYASHARDIAARYESVASPIAQYFGVAFHAGARVLDIGVGSGRDLALLIAWGYDGYGVEPVAALASQAIEHHPELAGRICAGALPAIGEPFGGGFDGILCGAVLMHVPDYDLLDTTRSLRRLLRPHGRLLVSLPSSRSDVIEGERGVDGRLFKNYTPEYIQLLFERTGFHLIGHWLMADALGREGTSWFTLLLELRESGSLRAVDQEGILDGDVRS